MEVDRDTIRKAGQAITENFIAAIAALKEAATDEEISDRMRDTILKVLSSYSEKSHKGR
nr:MAG TPA: hypothetical protein [Bacteriophage sp.]